MAGGTVVNYWPQSKCAKAFWSQQEARPYQELLRDTLAWADPRAGERWLDLGCGGGALTRGLWERSRGQVAFILGLDCAAANASAYERLQQTLSPPPHDRIHFLCHDFSHGLDILKTGAFDHAVSGLSISYAEHYDTSRGVWTREAYRRLLCDLRRILKPGGRFVFSVNVPEPSWLRVAWDSVGGMLRKRKLFKHLRNSWRMLRYGRWLKAEARRGRFHYLPATQVIAHLEDAGWSNIRYRLSYSQQAYVFEAVNHG